ncbi:DUF4328 domain-containing protein [Nonomuraea sp. NPDC050536]|uniref:DUF4328 domain-containing protein n=1 Tax=Nonomuraea sp. NPDC050536 TaxID=3364366 RepID=UPI0037C823BC
MHPLRSARLPAVFALTALALVSLAYIGAAWADLQDAALMDRYVADPDSVSMAQFDASDVTDYGVAMTLFGTFVMAALLFVNWLYRVRDNAEVLSPDEHRHGRRWLTWGWAVPVVNLWFPKRIVDDIWNASGDRSQQHRSGLVRAWWAAWLLSNLSGIAVSAVFPEVSALTYRLDAVIDGVVVVAAGLAAVVVWKITGFQEARRTSLARVQ